MAVGRIVIGEFQDEDEASRFAAHYADNASTIFTEAKVLLSMRTTDTSVMTISVYDDDDAADRANGLREQDISQWQLRDVTLLCGTLDLMHIKT